MSIGPMTGLFLHDSHLSYEHIFSIGLLTCVLGFLAAVSVKAPRKVPVKRPPVSLDRFILLKGIPAGIALLLLSIPYGATTNYVAVYAREIGLQVPTGFFFTLMWGWVSAVSLPESSWTADTSPRLFRMVFM